MGQVGQVHDLHAVCHDQEGMAAVAAGVDPPAYVKIAYSNTSACGALRSADGGQIRLTVTGNHDPIAIPLTQITNLTIVSTCD